MKRPYLLECPAWIQRIGDLETIVEITSRIVYAYDHDGLKVEDSRSIIWVVEDLHDLFLELHAAGDKKYWEDREYCMYLDAVVGAFLECMQKEPNWINEKHRSTYGKETAEDLLKRHGKMEFLKEPKDGG